MISFLGSGTTLKVCRLTNRKGIGYEINPDYKERILQRIDKPWSPPEINSMYVTLGSEKLKTIIQTTIETAIKSLDPSFDYQTLSSKVLKQLGKDKLLTKNLHQKTRIK